jgi:hypothetical protein
MDAPSPDLYRCGHRLCCPSLLTIILGFGRKAAPAAAQAGVETDAVQDLRSRSTNHAAAKDLRRATAGASRRKIPFAARSCIKPRMSRSLMLAGFIPLLNQWCPKNFSLRAVRVPNPIDQSGKRRLCTVALLTVRTFRCLRSASSGKNSLGLLPVRPPASG